MSRRVATLALTLILLCFTACAKPQPAEPLSVNFTCDFRAQYSNMTAAGKLTRYTAGTLRLDFTEPETLNGLSAEWNGDTVTLRFLGLSYTVDPATLPEGALGEHLLNALDAALRGDGNREEQDGRVTVTGLVGDTAYTYVYDADSGAPLSLEAPSLSVTFSHVQAS